MDKMIRRILFVVLFQLILQACIPGTLVPVPSITTKPVNPTRTPVSSPTHEPTVEREIPTPTAPHTIVIEATVWDEAPRVPILSFHQFKNDEESPSDFNGHKIQLEDFRAALQALYDQGYSLVSMPAWLDGNLTLPEGRRPLVLTMDDLFYTNQILLDNGVPNPETGIGVLWDFSKEHPDFGFHLMLFIVLGDKYFPFDPQYALAPIFAGRDWEDELAQTIAWCIEHDARVFNHTYLHGYLGAALHPISMDEFLNQLWNNDVRLRELLMRIDREDLISGLDNMVALTGGIPPQSDTDWVQLMRYANPEGVLLEAVFHVYPAKTGPAYWQYLTGPYDPEYDPMLVPRIVANLPNIQYLVDHSSSFPSAGICHLEVETDQINTNQHIEGQLSLAIKDGDCPAGLYVVNGHLFDMRLPHEIPYENSQVGY